MRLGLIPETLLDRVMLAFGVGAPPAMTEAYAPLHARAIVAATEMGVFDALTGGGRSAAEVASARGMDARATGQLLNFLVSMRYLRYRDGAYELSGHTRRWLLADREDGIRDLILMKRLEWRWMEGLEDYLRSGVPANVHGTMSTDDWQAYQRGMRAQANIGASNLARLLPIPTGARDMIDIGGSHGYWSVVLCRRHPDLCATVLDLPDAVAQSAPLLEREGMGDRVVLRAGDALTDDIGTDAYDVVLMFSLVHHFDAAMNRRLVSRAAAALRPGGRILILEPLRGKPGGGQQGAFFDLYFGLTSESGTWTLEEMHDWQREAGLVPRPAPFPLRLVKDFGLAVADKPAVRA